MNNEMNQRIFVAGHRGMAGSAVLRRLEAESDCTVLTAGRERLDLRERTSVEPWFAEHRPTAVIFCAARVGGIHANQTFPVQFLSDNALMAMTTMNAAFAAGVPRFLFLGSTCIYPRDAPQPISEDSLLTSPLEKTNEAYALAKIAGLKLCQYYRQQHGVTYHSAMPTNLYGQGDNYHPEHSHVLPALIRRIHEAKERGADSVTIWGTGTPRREFLHVDDLADALVHLLKLDDPPDWVNVGKGTDVTIRELAQKVAQVVGFDGEIRTDPSKPDGTPRKVTDVRLLHSTGWRHRIELREGLERTYHDFLKEMEVGLRER